MPDNQWREINAAFSKQSSHFDEDDCSNPILRLWRQRIYTHVETFLKPNSRILELNAGTGIDAIYFAKQGHRVHATDLSDGMISTLQRKIDQLSLSDKITIQQVSFEDLDGVKEKFDFLFSNFGGLNCMDDLKKVTRHISGLLNPNGILTFVIMPRLCPWEWLWAFKGKFKNAFRRFNSKGADTHLEGHHFTTYYFSLRQIQKSMGDLNLLKVESLGCISPPPSATKFVQTFPRFTKFLNQLDVVFSNKFPFDRWGDHLIVTFQKKT
jgi:ubiquinone/menaquinone biosynthesis C-methylase UbiE